MTSRLTYRRGARVTLALLLASSVAVLAQEAPESLLPPGFDTPAPTPPPTAPTAAPAPGVSESLPSGPVEPPAQGSGGGAPPRAAESDPLAGLDPELLAQLLDSRPKYDIPPAAQRKLDTVGVFDESEGGMPAAGVGGLRGQAMRGVIVGTKGPIISRWGQIVLRRALLSRQNAPVGLRPADWAALRANLLLRMGEADAARALVQEVDVNASTPAMDQVSLAAYAATADFVGLCPLVSLRGSALEGDQWYHARAICAAYGGNESAAMQQLDRAMNRGIGRRIDILLAQKLAGAAGKSRRAVNIEWDDVKDLTPWRYGMTVAVGLVPPAPLLEEAGPLYALLAARAPMLPLPDRAAAADVAAARGVLSSRAMVDLYSQMYGDEEMGEEWTGRAVRLRTAYLARTAPDRVKALYDIWGDHSDLVRRYSRQVLTAYAAARIPPREAFEDQAGDIVGAMLTAGLDRNLSGWAEVAEEGSMGWALTALARPDGGQVSRGPIDLFANEEGSEAALKTRLLIAGLAGLGRIDAGSAQAMGADRGMNLSRETRWSRAIAAAAERNSQLEVVYLVGLGMQGSDWSKMTGFHLYHITAALRRVGLEGEARMIAAEAVARA